MTPIETALMSAIGALSTVVVVLWKRIERELRECRTDRRDLWNHILKSDGRRKLEEIERIQENAK